MSWHGTCGITKLPIKDGENVYLFLLEKQNNDNNGGGVTYHDKMYKPIMIPIQGTYNDYGRIENIKDIQNLIFEHIKPILEHEELDIEAFIKNVERKEYNNLGFMLVHADLYKLIVKEMSRRETIHETILREHCERQIKEFINKEEPKHLFGDDGDNNSFEQFTRNHKSLKKLAKTMKQTNIELKTEFLDFYIFDIFMGISRNTWCIQSGSGSQAEEYNIHKIIAEYVIEKEKELHIGYTADYTDYDEVRESLGKETLIIW